MIVEKSEPVLYTVHAAAQALGRTEASVRNLVAKRQIEVSRLGNRVYVSQESLLDFLRGKITQP